MRLLQGPFAAIVADEEILPLKPGSVDLIVSLMSLHATNDTPGTMVQIARALKPDGLFLAAFSGNGTLGELRESLLQAEIELTGGASPRVFPFADVRDVGGLLQRAGFALPVTDVENVTVRYDSIFNLMTDLRAMGMQNILRDRSRKPVSRRLFCVLPKFMPNVSAIRMGVSVPPSRQSGCLAGHRTNRSKSHSSPVLPRLRWLMH